MSIGWIKLHRKFANWEWRKKPNYVSFFIHCLERANHKEGRYAGEIIPAGSFTTSLEQISNATGLSQMVIRTIIKNLKLTNEITYSSTPKRTMISITNWHLYQPDNAEVNNQLTNDYQTINKRLTYNNNDNNKKNVENEINHAQVAPSQIKARATDIIASYNQILALKFQPWKGTNPALEAKLAPCLEIMPDLMDWRRYFTAMGSHDFSWYAGKNLNIYLLLNPERVDQFLNGTFTQQSIADIFQSMIIDTQQEE